MAPYDPDKPDFAAFLQLPSAAHVLGTDNFGRDVLSRIIYGTESAIIVSAVCSLCSWYSAWYDRRLLWRLDR